jgi:SAM-dependent methyltransferase
VNTATENAFGQTWRDQKADFWDWMWTKHEGSEMTETLIELVLEHEHVIEIGCGAGHMLGEAIKRGWHGSYLGFDISQAALERTEARLRATSAVAGHVVCGDFLVPEQLELAREHGAQLIFARGVLQHQSHWAPMVLAALRCAPVVAMGIGYTTTGPRHGGGWKKAGHYDVIVSLPLIEYEARAMGLEIDVLPMPNPKRPKHQEALVFFRRPEADAAALVQAVEDGRVEQRVAEEAAVIKADVASRVSACAAALRSQFGVHAPEPVAELELFAAELVPTDA